MGFGKPSIQRPCFKLAKRAILLNSEVVTASQGNPSCWYDGSQLSASLKLRHGTKAGWWEGRGAPLTPLCRVDVLRVLQGEGRKAPTQEEFDWGSR